MAKAADKKQQLPDNSPTPLPHSRRHQQLIREILDRSNASDWKQAKFEWKLHFIYLAYKPKQCLCGHFPIREICVLQNTLNAKTAMVGNVCVKKFLGIPTDKIFSALKRIEDNLQISLNPYAIDYAHDQHWMNDWERDFYHNVWRKRKLSDRQLTTIQKINRKILLRFKESWKKPGAEL